MERREQKKSARTSAAVAQRSARTHQWWIANLRRKRGSSSYHQNLTVIHFPSAARSARPPFVRWCSPAVPTTSTLLCGLERYSGQPVSPLGRSVVETMGLEACARRPGPLPRTRRLRWNQIAFSPLWSKWSLPSALLLLRMLKRHPSRNCTCDGGGCDWIRGENSQRAHFFLFFFYNILPAGYATRKSAHRNQQKDAVVRENQ